VTAWLHERTVELRRRERAKEEAARKAAEDRAQRLNQAGAAQPLPPSERESLSFEAAAERMRAQRLHQAGAAQPQGVTFKGLTFKGFEAVAERMERERLLHVGPPPPKPLSFDDAAERWFPTQAQARDRQKITKQFEDLKQRGNQAYQQQQYELANQYYIAATSADPKNVTGSLHTIYSNMSAVFATQGDWRGSYNYAYYAVQLVPSFAKGHSRMATALAALEHFAEARTAYITCLQIEPANNYARAQIAELDKKIAQGLGRPLQGPQPSHAASTAPPVEPEPQTQLQPPSQPLPKPKPPAAPAAPVGESSAPAVAPKAKAQCSGSAWGLVAGLPTAAGAAAQPQAAPKRTASSTDGPSLPKDEGIPKRQHTSPSTLAGAPVAETAAELSPQVLQQMGNTAFRKNDHEEAIRCFDEAILQCSRGNGPAESLLVALYSNRSAVLCAIHRYEEALADADRAVELNPTWSRGHSRRGNALHAMAKKGTATKDAAREAYERALQLDPENSIVRRALDGLIATMDDNEVEVQVEA
jgi:tetratricopeptide (TPR) repeat protein